MPKPSQDGWRQVAWGAEAPLPGPRPETRGAFIDQACTRDLEGIVAKPAISPYRDINGQAPWIKIKNAGYTQAEGRAEVFNKRR